MVISMLVGTLETALHAVLILKKIQNRKLRLMHHYWDSCTSSDFSGEGGTIGHNIV